MKPTTFTSQWQEAVGVSVIPDWNVVHVRADFYPFPRRLGRSTGSQFYLIQFLTPVASWTLIANPETLHNIPPGSALCRITTLASPLWLQVITQIFKCSQCEPHSLIYLYVEIIDLDDLSMHSLICPLQYKAAEAAAKHQAKDAFTGTFKSTDRNSSITLAVDGGPGVVIKKWISNSTDFLATELYAGYNDFRLYPTELKFEGPDGLTYYKFHMDTLSQNGAPYGGDPWNESNDYWFQVDSISYNVLSPDAFVVGFDQDGIVQKVASQALRTTMVRSA